VAVGTLLAQAGWSDVDAGALGGVAIVSTTGNGTWQYSTDGIAWTAFGATSPVAALLLGTGTQVRYLPDGANGESAGFAFHAWDQTVGVAGSTADVSAGGASGAWSVGVANASLVVTAVNDAPILTGANDLASISEDDAANAGTLVSALIAGHIADVDTGAIAGIAVTGVDEAHGLWQYSLDGGATWSGLGGVWASAARLLADDANTRVRFVPAANWNGSVADGITFRAWDRSSGAAGDAADVGAGGGSSAFSVQSASAGITVDPVDDAPRLLSFSLSMPTGGSRVLVAPDFPIEDLDGQVGTRFIDVSGLTGARFELTSAPDVAITSFSFDQVVAGVVRLVHTDQEVVPAFDVVVRDGANAGVAVEAVISLVPPPDHSGLLAAAAGSGSSTPAPVAPPPAAEPPAVQPPKPEAADAGADAATETEGNVVLTMPVPRVPAQAKGPAVPPDAKPALVPEAPKLPAMVVGPAALSLAPVGGPVMTSGATVRADLIAGEPLPESAPLDDDLAGEVSVAWLPSEENASERAKTAEEEQMETVVTGVRMASVGLSVGAVSWVLRAGGIASSLLAGVPAWRYLDPLPILERSRLQRVIWRDDTDEAVPDEQGDEESGEVAARPAKGVGRRVLDQMLGGGR
jgi:hypothetical protein